MVQISSFGEDTIDYRFEDEDVSINPVEFFGNGYGVERVVDFVAAYIHPRGGAPRKLTLNDDPGSYSGNHCLTVGNIQFWLTPEEVATLIVEVEKIQTLRKTA